MKQPIVRDTKNIGLKSDRKRTRRHKPLIITKLNFADLHDIARVAEDIKQIKDFLHRVRNNAARIGQRLHADTTELMCLNQKQ